MAIKGLLLLLAAVAAVNWGGCSSEKPKPPTQEERIRILTEQMSSPKPEVREKAIDETMRADFPLKAKKKIARMGLNDEKEPVQIMSVKILGEKPTQANLEQVLETSRSESPAVSEVSMTILKNQGRLGNRLLVQDALDQIREKNADPAAKFRKIGLSFAEVQPLLDEMLPNDQALKHEILSSLDKSLAIQGLVLALRSETDPDRLFDALFALDRKGVPFSVDYLYANGEDPGNVEITLAIIKSLGRIQDPRSGPVLEKLSRSELPAVQSSAAAALRSIRGN